MKIFAVYAFVIPLVMIRNSELATSGSDDCYDNEGVSHGAGEEFVRGCMDCSCHQKSNGNLYSICYSDPRPSLVSDYCHVVESNCTYTIEPEDENETRECEIFGMVG